MKIEKLIKFLESYNRWRRGAKMKQPHPQKLGLAIDEAVEILKKLAVTNEIAKELNKNKKL